MEEKITTAGDGLAATGPISMPNVIYDKAVIRVTDQSCYEKPVLYLSVWRCWSEA